MVKIGDIVVREPVTVEQYDEDLKKHTKAAMRGKVVYVHPEGRSARVSRARRSEG